VRWRMSSVTDEGPGKGPERKHGETAYGGLAAKLFIRVLRKCSRSTIKTKSLQDKEDITIERLEF